MNVLYYCLPDYADQWFKLKKSILYFKGILTGISHSPKNHNTSPIIPEP